MPYRRLPTTDKARIRALDAALLKTESLNDDKKSVADHTIDELVQVKTNFENYLKQYELDTRIQAEKHNEYKVYLERARMYMQHYLQVLFMAIDRGEIKPEVLLLYGLDPENKSLPVLNTEEEILKWGQKVIDGDQKRIQNGGSALYNPSIALVRFKIEEFKDAAIFQQNLKRNTLRSYEKIQKLRKTTNEFISRLWNEIEEKIDTDDAAEKRNKAAEYGIVYVLRRKELKELHASKEHEVLVEVVEKPEPEKLQTNLQFEFE